MKQEYFEPRKTKVGLLKKKKKKTRSIMAEEHLYCFERKSNEKVTTLQISQKKKKEKKQFNFYFKIFKKKN